MAETGGNGKQTGKSWLWPAGDSGSKTDLEPKLSSQSHFRKAQRTEGKEYEKVARRKTVDMTF